MAGATASRWILSWLAVAMLGCGSPIPPPGEAWIEARTPHFVIRSDAARGDVERAAANLELFHATVVRLTGIRVPSGNPPTVILLLRRHSMYRHYRPIDKVGGFFLSFGYGSYAVMPAGAERGKSDLSVLYHEYTHHLLRHYPGHIPFWYEEGFAEILSRFRVVGDEVVVGGRIKGWMYVLNRQSILPGWRPLPLSRLLELDRATWRDERAELVYAQSWALSHYFLFSSPERLAQLEDYLQRRDRREPVAEAFDAAFDVSEDQLWQEVRDHMDPASFVHGVTPVAEPDSLTLPAVRVAPRSEVLANLGDVLTFTGGKRDALAVSLLEEAIRLDPEQGLAHVKLGVLHTRGGRHGDAETAFARALALEPLNARFRVERANALMRVAMDRPEALASAREEYLRAANLDPRVPYPFLRFGLTFLNEPKSPQGAAMLERAFERWPTDSRVAAALAALDLRAGRPEKARRVLAQNLRVPTDAPQLDIWLVQLEELLAKGFARH